MRYWIGIGSINETRTGRNPCSRELCPYGHGGQKADAKELADVTGSARSLTKESVRRLLRPECHISVQNDAPRRPNRGTRERWPRNRQPQNGNRQQAVETASSDGEIQLASSCD
jgi:hypothetical protein